MEFRDNFRVVKFEYIFTTLQDEHIINRKKNRK